MRIYCAVQLASQAFEGMCDSAALQAPLPHCKTFYPPTAVHVPLCMAYCTHITAQEVSIRGCIQDVQCKQSAGTNTAFKPTSSMMRPQHACTHPIQPASQSRASQQHSQCCPSCAHQTLVIVTNLCKVDNKQGHHVGPQGTGGLKPLQRCHMLRVQHTAVLTG
jgi:hypothetical protein